MYRGRCENLVELREALACGGDSFAVLLGNFLDQFYLKPSAEAISPEPRLLAGLMSNGEYYDAYFAAIAEHMAMMFGFPVPEWAGERARFLSTPRVFAKSQKLRELLLAECPDSFKRRGVIVSSDALARA